MTKSATKLAFHITDLKYDRLHNWQLAIEEKIRKHEIETGKTWDDQPISEEKLEMLKNGMASVHWGYCTEPYSYEFSPQHPNASRLPERLQKRYGPMIYVRVTNNVTGDTVDLSETRSEWDSPPQPLGLIGFLKTLLYLPPLRRTKYPQAQDLIELGGIPAGSDEL